LKVRLRTAVGVVSDTNVSEEAQLGSVEVLRRVVEHGNLHTRLVTLAFSTPYKYSYLLTLSEVCQ